MKKYSLIIPGILIGIVAFIFSIYGIYWLAKTVSYKVFYEDMVRATITEMVKPVALKLGTNFGKMII